MSGDAEGRARGTRGIDAKGRARAATGLGMEGRAGGAKGLGMEGRAGGAKGLGTEGRAGGATGIDPEGRERAATGIDAAQTADGRPRRPTVIDVARAAGVSVKTVSRVINNVPTVNPQIVERVLAAVADLGFRRNDMARNLRSGHKSVSIGLIIEDFANPFYSTITAAVQEVAARHDALLITASSEEDPERERRFLLTMCDRRVDGLLVVPAGSDHAYLRPEIEMGVPAVFLDRPPVGLHVDAVLVDNAGGARAGIAAMVERGHDRIALLVDSLSIHTMRERLAGAEAALEAAGIPHDPELVRVDLHEPSATVGAIAEMLASARPPTAFFCGNNRIAVGAIRELWRRGSSAALVAFDDFELSHLMPLPLTVISYDTRQIGKIGAELLFRRIGGERPRPSTTILPTQLVERGVGAASAPASPDALTGTDAPAAPADVPTASVAPGASDAPSAPAAPAGT